SSAVIASPQAQPLRARRSVERMTAVEVARLEPPPQALLQAADTQTTAPGFHAGFRPNGVGHHVDLRGLGDPVVDAAERDPLHFSRPPIRDAGRGVEAAIDAPMRLGYLALEAADPGGGKAWIVAHVSSLLRGRILLDELTGAVSASS